MQNFWKQNLGWKSPGYATWVNFDGTRNKLSDYNLPTNGVAGFNSQSLHISYRGGIENIGTTKAPKYKAKDTRTIAQKSGILDEIFAMLTWLKNNGNDLQDLMIIGHYHFSTDKNKNGAIESFERIKECPSFDAYLEYAPIMQAINPNYSKLKLPRNR
jgi:N-acetylmuramoyl-L-alanine amidase